MEELRSDRKTLTSVEHALDILDVFASDFSSLSLNEICEATGIHKSSVYRLVKVLLKRGYLDKDVTTGKYRLGLRLINLASSRINDFDLISEARPLMMRLHSETLMATQLCILKGTDVIYLDEVSGTSSKWNNMGMGYRGEAFCSSLGKCLLAALSGEELKMLFHGYRFTKYTENTIDSFEKLKNELKTVRKNGYALNHGEYNSLLSSVACPIYDYSGAVIAAISLGGASYLFIPETIERILPHLRRYAMQLSKCFGYMEDNQHRL